MSPRAVDLICMKSSEIRPYGGMFETCIVLFLKSNGALKKVFSAAECKILEYC